MIYSRFGTPVTILQSYQKEIEAPSGDKFPAWFAKLAYAEDLEDGSAKAGDILYDGQFENAAECLQADDGWSEILDECEAMEGPSPE